ncbi:bifunctional [glutamine synthetase] adenylyltransferase/[glutamine synthetase]-adenylyl-L-tyrosine phosphorylase [Brevibacterium sp. BRM-1]|uniref:bifunctional [glutamine synthetase] adenylyltransferase/[glutamine synthetase]-adenylyl-L-tyrosine phosphorylase n=1 Tax=Brevibacterium sp. BRM-1 TaxID=2999062 RepID=UPI002280517E|nr:bifunctional [glutamine synthetase] adenylyltransferase/[glutamine synthetase]-adenylyl-L-tyrosine phosphorylase [Brevibacterium sp. BRM-1]WAL40720.1 bifunctional [glutamine synthetase] adenylyltransferase/[glutamine synthetase]-adenylyl-L-tyrosine phosphorylase [Brevibacterium sp. BRM-1]
MAVTWRGGDPARSQRAGGQSERIDRFLGEAAQLLDAPALEGDDFRALVSAAPDPGAVALGALRVAEAAQAADAVAEAAPAFTSAAPLARFAALAGASEACTDHLARHPRAAGLLAEPAGDLMLGHERSAAPVLRAALLEAVGADPDSPRPVAQLAGEEGVAALRAAYRDRLIMLAADDLTAPDPQACVAEVSRILSDLAAAAVEAGLAVARAEVPGAAGVDLAIIGMGKCGARELNYVSDVDVVYCWEPVADDAQDPDAPEPDSADGASSPGDSGDQEGDRAQDAAAGEADGADDVAGDGGSHEAESSEDRAQIAARLAVRTAEAVSGHAAEPALWELDAALRPEGKAGPLVRTLGEFSHYYREVAHNWEFQALLKARPIAGAAELGRRWAAELSPLVWTASGREGFIDGVRAMRRRVVDLLPSAEADRQLKLGAGGLRDVEFSAQLLQLVHGADDEEIRVPATLSAVAVLGERGYMSREDAGLLGDAYRFMRVVEHRLQMPRMQRTALLPSDEAKLRLLARTVYGSGDRSAERLLAERERLAHRVRALHEQIFYRPILEAAAGEPHLAGLSDAAARERLSAFGYRDTKSAMKHIRALTSGVSRPSNVIRQALPALLDWFSSGVDPDAALLAFRRLSEDLAGSAWFLRLLRDSGSAAKSLAHVLSLSRFATELLLVNPAAAAWLDDPAQLAARSGEELAGELAELAGRGRGDAIAGIRGVWGRELLRTALADILDADGPAEVAARLSAAMDACIHAAVQAVRAELDPQAGIGDYEFAVIAMGRLGGAEIGYFSDADVMFAYRAGDGAPEGLAAHVKKVALALTSRLGRTLSAPIIELDADLRPEGRSGPLVRSLESYRAYYAKWSEPWEAQALLRARPVGGDAALCEDYVDLIDGLRYPQRVPESSLMQMRRLKARMEGERLPRGADPRLHLKLGVGGLSDVEWTVQLLQLRHAHDHPALRTTSTLGALHAAVEAELVDPADARVLEAAWTMATEVRSAVMLFRGRTADSLPADRSELEATARLMGYGTGGAQALSEAYLAATRRARRVVERLFFDFDEEEGFTSAEDRRAGRR